MAFTVPKWKGYVCSWVLTHTQEALVLGTANIAALLLPYRERHQEEQTLRALAQGMKKTEFG